MLSQNVINFYENRLHPVIVERMREDINQIVMTKVKFRRNCKAAKSNGNGFLNK